MIFTSSSKSIVLTATWNKKQKRLIEYEKTNWNPNNASKSIKELIYEATKSLFTQKFFSNLCFMRYASIYTVISSITSANYTIIKERNIPKGIFLPGFSTSSAILFILVKPP